MSTLTEGRRAAEAIMSEASGHRSRDNLTVAASQTILANALLGALVVAGSVTVSASAVSGTGNGTITMADPPVNSKVRNGVYRVVCVTAASDGGTFRVERPDGVDIGNATVGVAFNKEVKFTIADGSTDFAVGAFFEITVGVEDPSDKQYVAYDPAGTDGSEIPVAYSPYAVTTAADETKKTLGLTRDCELNTNLVAWPSGISAANKAKAIAALTERGIIVR